MRHLSHSQPSGVRREEKKWLRFRVRIEKNSYPKETLSRRFSFRSVLINEQKNLPCAKLFSFERECCHIEKINESYYFPLIYIHVSLKKSVCVCVYYNES